MKRPQDVGVDGDRIERIIAWLRLKKPQLLASKKGRITFDYKDSIITARHEDVQEKI